MSANQRRTPAEQYLDPKPHFGVTQDDQRSTTFPSFCDWNMRHLAEMEKLDAQIAELRAERAASDLRDRFAMAALNQRKMLSTGAWYAADAAREAYEIADAMILARKQ